MEAGAVITKMSVALAGAVDALMAMGRLDEAFAEWTRSQELDSRSLVIASGIGWRHTDRASMTGN